MSTKRPFAELLSGLQQNKLPLMELIQSLNERGPVQSPLHRAELAMLDEALAKNKLDEKLHRLLTAKLKDLQNVKPAPAAPAKPAASMAGDKTVVAAAPANKAVSPGASADKTTLNPSGGNGADGDERTAMNPAGGGDGGFDLLMPNDPAAEATQVGQASAETTGFKPSEPVTGSRTTGGKSGPSTSSWQRVATEGGPEREVHAGDTLKERFYLDKEVGRGGMGIVFKARDERKVEAQDKNPWVAVKVLNPEFRKHPQALVALQRESRKAQQLTHDNILRVYDFDKDKTVIYMTMEYVDGGSLKDVIKKHPGGMPFDKGWPIIEGLARGLGRAHRDNIVHSDFKPGNVMMTSDMIPKLFDLGIARAAQSGATAKGETTVFDAGELGALTPAYASLEMIQGQPPELIDDNYALGITAYEILTGKHPYAKKNAEQAMKEGLKLPVVHGLTRRQRKTLEGSLAFKRADRIKTCDDFIDGLRPRTWKEVALPIGTGVAVTLVVVVLVLGPGVNYMRERRVAGLVERYEQAAFADPAEAVTTFEALDAKEKALARQQQTQIQDYFIKIANGKWDLAAKPPQYDYPDALAVVNSAKTLFPDSARVAENLRRLDDEKKNLLSKLNDEFNAHVDAARIYEDKEPNVVQTVAVIRRVDPNNDLLKDAKLLGRYRTDVRNALEGGQYDTAEKRAATSVKVFPKAEDLLALQTSVKQAHEMQVASLKERELREKMTSAQAKEELVKLAANPLFTPDWQVNVNVAMSKLTADTSPETQQVKVSLAGAYAKQLGTKLDEKELVSAQLVADTGMKLFPGAPSLMQEVNRLTQARKVQETEDAAKAAVAEVDTLKRTLRTKADANDIRGAQSALDKLRASLPATDPFLSGDGPKALGEAYLRQAEKQAEQGRYANAQKFVADGLKVAPALEGLKIADKKFKIDGSIAALTAGAEQPGSANGEQLKAALDVLRTADPTRFDKLSGQFQSTALARIQALTNTDPAAAGKGKAEWLKVYPQYQQLASLVIPTGVAAAPAAATPSLPTEAKKARRAPGVDTCSASFAGFGRSGKATCTDDVAGAAGPKLVVVPGVGGGSPFAITKYEVTVGQFDAFCAATGKCRAAGGNDSLPRTGVSLATAKAYAAWLTETTGFTYRVPTDAEWAHAANAGGQGAGSDFQCIQMAGSSQVRGGNAIPATTGKPNPWGLINAVGNAAEWVEGGASRGGHYNVSTGQCTVDWRQSGSGESDTVGVRLVREMG